MLRTGLSLSSLTKKQKPATAIDYHKHSLLSFKVRKFKEVSEEDYSFQIVAVEGFRNN